MAIISRILDTIRRVRYGANVTDVKVNKGSSITISAENYASAGDDANPLPNDYAILSEIPRIGTYASHGFIDPKNANITNPGEKRIYARDSSGTIKATIYLKNDGEIVIENDNVTATLSALGGFNVANNLGFIDLNATGLVSVNGFTFAPGSTGGSTGGSITVDSIIANGKELADHKHGGVQTGGGETSTNL